MLLIGLPLCIIALALCYIAYLMHAGKLVGPRGEPGPQGEKGDPGERGEQGRPGENGRDARIARVPQAVAPTSEIAQPLKLNRVETKREDGTWAEGDWVACDSNRWVEAYHHPHRRLVDSTGEVVPGSQED